MTPAPAQTPAPPTRNQDRRTPDLYTQGYRVTMHGPDRFRVTTPQGNEYIVEPSEAHCSCRATVVCKHLKNLPDLLSWQACALHIEAQSARTGFGFNDEGLRLHVEARHLEVAAAELRMKTGRESRRAA